MEEAQPPEPLNPRSEFDMSEKDLGAGSTSPDPLFSFLVAGSRRHERSLWIERGEWIFAGLLAINLTTLQSFLSPATLDPALFVALLALAPALPVHALGLITLRAYKEQEAFAKVLAERFPRQPLSENEQSSREKAYAEELLKIAGETRLPKWYQRRLIDAAMPFEEREARITAARLRNIIVLSTLLTSINLGAAFWHISWIVTGVFFFALIGCVVYANIPHWREKREIQADIDFYEKAMSQETQEQ